LFDFLYHGFLEIKEMIWSGVELRTGFHVGLQNPLSTTLTPRSPPKTSEMGRKDKIADLTFPIVIVIFHPIKMVCATKMLILAKFLATERYKNDHNNGGVTWCMSIMTIAQHDRT
jgi:hypothetical protein